MLQTQKISWPAALTAAAGAWLGAAILGGARETGYQLLWVAAAILAFAGTRAWLSEGDRRAKACFGVLGALFVFALGLGYRLEAADETGWGGLLLCLGLALCWGPVAGQAALCLCRMLEGMKPGRETGARRAFWLAFGVILLCWLPVQLAYWPCCYGYDLNSQVNQVIYHDYTAHHPLLHTLLVGAFYNLGGLMGSHTVGALMYGVFQMLCLAASMAYAISYLARLRCPRALLIALTALFALAPNHSLMSIGCTKDVLFGAVMITAVIDLHRLYRHPDRLRSWKHALRLTVLLALLCLLRNNAAIAVALFAVAALITVGRGQRRRMLALIAAALVLQSGVSAGLKAATNAEEGLINEMLSVPAQQLARIYDKYGYDEPTSYEVMEWVPHADMYQASRADFTKLHLKVHREGELLGFVKFWVREFFHFPIEYLDAFLLNAKGYWFVDDTSFAAVYGEWPTAYTGAIITEQFASLDVEFTSYFPQLRDLYEYLFSRNNYQQVPGLSTLIHPATYTWLLLLGMCWAVWRRRWGAFSLGCLLAAYLLTLFLGPCTLIRYCYYLMIAAPVLLALLASEKTAE